MSTTPTANKSGLVRLFALITVIFGAVFFVAGAATWIAVSTNLKAEKITVSEDATFAGGTVDTPWEAFSQADIIKHHALDATGGKTYAELDREDPLRDVAMNGSFLRASLFTSVVAFGVALLVMGLGVVLALVGLALRKLTPAVASTSERTTPITA
ncbi:aromatic ring-opening dioxygenase LigA [Cellulomonas sp.]|uniref:aromatic ring-opening dioxygenase LigA n=1 Tax=Cellulomonas sp. TaxID=40001 RepID=UPI0025862002|nr:aromatic ring-opening dioxygenase LigA [Cellulomonas sp.]MCR6690229.1 aromatic ring-opening dioxygenase LigA [Cellulomonas sp.]